MTWTKLSDDYADDAWKLSNDAFRLHTEGLVWSNRKLLDCLIPEDDLRRFAKNPEAVHELLAAGFWSEGPGYYQILHHADYQRTSDEVIAAQSRSRTNGKKGGRPRTREIWRSDKTQNQNPAGNPEGKAGGSAASSKAQADESENRAVAGSQNPSANPAANPEGQAYKRRNSSPGFGESGAKRNLALDRDSWPTDEPGLQWRIEFEEKGITTLQKLMDLEAIPSVEQAKKMLTAAFPGRRF